MKINEVKANQLQDLKKIADELGVDFDSLERLLESVKTKKLHRRINFHQQRISDEIEKATK